MKRTVNTGAMKRTTMTRAMKRTTMTSAMKHTAIKSAMKRTMLGKGLRSTGKPLLDHPKGKMLSTLGARSFSEAAPKLWNGLPAELRQATSLDSFKSKLKTYLFKKYFDNL